MFLIASENEMIGYSTVRYYPEIFVTIEKFVNDWFEDYLNIGYDWTEIKQYSYIITIPVKYNDMSYRNGYISGKDGYDANDILELYAKFCDRNYDYAEQVPKCFWDNIWLINHCLYLISSGDKSILNICAGIKHNVVIPYDKLKINII